MAVHAEQELKSGMDGVEVCRHLRSSTDAYVIVVSGRAGELDRLIDLEVLKMAHALLLR